MTEVLKLVYIMIIFLYIFLVVADTDPFAFCIKDSNCGQDLCTSPNEVPECRLLKCQCIKS
ncbi:putative Late nodulin [Medicago truncatula]|uniref:Nodule Cysteine-Rich (NCR) secreted peptide n=1 Tax=Medicago truncatula TaxID=3880 RepID=A0A072UK90_MEDTR|nr:Nodule Cysteine-Rich (NCR) secreted peptide [Medicago truncatula]RHN60942.1 putative Late nodulin [Medicago truncatula]